MTIAPRPFQADTLEFTPLPADYQPRPGQENDGRYMLTVPWSQAKGWGTPKIAMRRPLEVDPVAGVMQYAVTCFEGMKCFKTDNGDLRLFRPNKNFDRLKRSADRLGLPSDWDNKELLQLLSTLVSLEGPDITTKDGGNLYIRPTILETSGGFGVRGEALAPEALLYIVTTHNLGAATYNSAEEGAGLRLDARTDYRRAFIGGTGSYKLGANYGQSSSVVSIAKRPNYLMNLWLHDDKHHYISEAGGMNIFVVKKATDGFTEFVTMGLEDGLVLPGITRESLIELIEDHAAGRKDFPVSGMPKQVRVVERNITMKEIISSLEDGTLLGMFGCGTGVCVAGVAEITYQEADYKIPSNPLIILIRDALTGLYKGRIQHDDWSYRVPQDI
ncbi:branched-chain-amino-acid transaminase [Cryptococcus wingfieldii CBS 7118]|uniref:Branched-chain-amino-acid aminotransferase n=1 Tax=Cryptococcus wingfieldii CBS 7118 TaxID=1295528 RepID=A0A1E3JC85_9TREE|nr:branched-chain-amino-acid transaminase [Cryptococcus wingfieldii CBS 7118]ODN98442.1 branched-chain-amino-acid transaminase [Cryptococcus wingfieldii CBS 7118]